MQWVVPGYTRCINHAFFPGGHQWSTRDIADVLCTIVNTVFRCVAAEKTPCSWLIPSAFQSETSWARVLRYAGDNV